MSLPLALFPPCTTGLALTILDRVARRLIQIHLPTLAHFVVFSRGVIIVIDGLNKLDEQDAILDWIPASLPPNIKILLSTGNGLYHNHVMYHGWPTVSVPPLNSTERHQLVSNFLKNYAKSLSQEQLNLIINGKTSPVIHPPFNHQGDLYSIVGLQLIGTGMLNPSCYSRVVLRSVPSRNPFPSPFFFSSPL